MAEPHVISSLRAKRAEIAGELAGLAKEIAQRRANLQHVDATPRLFARDLMPGTIKPKQQRKQAYGFAATSARVSRFAEDDNSRQTAEDFQLMVANSVPLAGEKSLRQVLQRNLSQREEITAPV